MASIHTDTTRNHNWLLKRIASRSRSMSPDLALSKNTAYEGCTNYGGHSAFLTDDGEIIEEMTEEEEQEIYEIPGTCQLNKMRSQTIGGNFLTCFAPMRRANSVPVASSSERCRGQSHHSHSNNSARLYGLFLSLEKEYVQLTLEQAELRAAAEFRAMKNKKLRASIEHLEKELDTLTKRVPLLHEKKNSLTKDLEFIPKEFSSVEEGNDMNHILNTLLLQRDLAHHKLEESQDELNTLRESGQKQLNKLHESPQISDEETKCEMLRITLEDKIQEYKRILREH
jgi:hypothetical protein